MHCHATVKALPVLPAEVTFLPPCPHFVSLQGVPSRQLQTLATLGGAPPIPRHHCDDLDLRRDNHYNTRPGQQPASTVPKLLDFNQCAHIVSMLLALYRTNMQKDAPCTSNVHDVGGSQPG